MSQLWWSWGVRQVQQELPREWLQWLLQQRRLLTCWHQHRQERWLVTWPLQLGIVSQKVANFHPVSDFLERIVGDLYFRNIKFFNSIGQLCSVSSYNYISTVNWLSTVASCEQCDENWQWWCTIQYITANLLLFIGYQWFQWHLESFPNSHPLFFSPIVLSAAAEDPFNAVE